MINRKELLEKISVFNTLGYSVVQIDEDYYTVNKFDPADNVIHKTVIEGKLITGLLSDTSFASHYSDPHRQREHIQTAMDGIKKVHREYHRNFKWILFSSF